MSRLGETARRIAPLDEAAMESARARQLVLTKPAGSLGRLEELSIQIAGIRALGRPRLEHTAVVVMAGDHGVAREGVSAYPAEVTRQMVANFVAGGAAINVLARGVGARLLVVDVGVAGDEPVPGVLSRRVAPGTRSFVDGPAMSDDEARAAIDVGLDVADALAADGISAVGLGDMGIGNTTAASALVAALTGAAARDVVGHGTGIDLAGLARKTAVIERALARHADARGPLAILAALGGLEIAGLAGLACGLASHRIAVVLDGHITTSAALVACALAPSLRPYLIASHRSTEPGHRVALDHLGLRPLLELDLRLGEGSGAALALPLLGAAVRVLDEMATFDEARVSAKA